MMNKMIWVVTWLLLNRVFFSELRHDHCYQSHTRSLIEMLEAGARKIFDHLMCKLPDHMHEKISNHHIVNLRMGVCSCASFIIIGQPYFCKHILAVLAHEKGISDASKLFAEYRTSIPCQSKNGLYRHDHEPITQNSRYW